MSFESAVNKLPGFDNWIDPINSNVWIHDYLIRNASGLYASVDAFYENNSFASNYAIEVDSSWAELSRAYSNLTVEIYEAHEQALEKIADVMSSSEKTTETVSTVENGADPASST